LFVFRKFGLAGKAAVTKAKVFQAMHMGQSNMSHVKINTTQHVKSIENNKPNQ